MKEDLKISRTLQLVFGILTLIFLTFFDDSAGKSLTTLLLVNIWSFYYIRLLFGMLDSNFDSDLDRLNFLSKIINSLFLIDIKKDNRKTKIVKSFIFVFLIVFIIVSTLTLKAHESSLIFWIPVTLVIHAIVLLSGKGSGVRTDEEGSYTDAFLCRGCGMDYMNSSGYCDACSRSRT